jgi:hypothetical protein
MTNSTRKGQPIRLDDAAASADPDFPAFLARPAKAPAYHGFPLLENSEQDGFVFGIITKPNGSAECGDAFVVAPNGSRAGIVWQVGEGEPSVVCLPSERRWGVYSFYFKGPMSSEAELAAQLRSIVPSLKAYYSAAEIACPESTRAVAED